MKEFTREEYKTISDHHEKMMDMITDDIMNQHGCGCSIENEVEISCEQHARELHNNGNLYQKTVGNPQRVSDYINALTHHYEHKCASEGYLKGALIKLI